MNLDSDEDEDTEEARFQEELQEAIRASQNMSSQSSTRMQEGAKPATSNRSVQSPKVSDQPSSTMSTFLSERAQLEKERLERQKRLRPLTAPELTAEDESEDEEPPAKRHKVSSSNLSYTRSNISGVSSSSSSASAIPTAEQEFWQGEIRQTATQHAEPRKDGKPTFRLTDVLGKVWSNHLLTVAYYRMVLTLS